MSAPRLDKMDILCRFSSCLCLLTVLAGQLWLKLNATTGQIPFGSAGPVFDFVSRPDSNQIF